MNKEIITIFLSVLLLGSKAFCMEPEIKIEGDLVSLKANNVELFRITDELARRCKVEIKVSDEMKREMVSIKLNKMLLEKVIMRLMNSICNNNYVMEYDKKGENHIVTRVFIGFREAKGSSFTVMSRQALTSLTSPTSQKSPTFTPPVSMIPDSLQKNFVGDKDTRKYYRLNSIKAMRLEEKNKVWFESSEEAERTGYLFVDTRMKEDKLRQESIKAINTPIPMRPDSLERYFIGDEETHEYYQLDYPGAMQLRAENRVWFKRKEDAERSGFIFVESPSSLGHQR